LVVALTGHRPHKLNNEYDRSGPVSSYIKDEIYKFLRMFEPETVISGMALGCDTMIAEIALQEDYVKKLIAAIPFVGQESRWPPNSQDQYRAILADPKVEKVIVCEGGYSASKMQIRNKWMVDNCDSLIAVWDGSPGGTANCVQYAIDVDRDLHFINPKDILNRILIQKCQ
jgi:uncharacterized phage-like protein YoqJ